MRVLLLSGGIDSLALAYWLRPPAAITIDYGQASAEGEIRAAKAIATAAGIAHETVRVDCSSLGSGDLLNRPALASAPAPEWWPYRNQMLATVAGMRALGMGATELLFGTVRSDAFHRDGTAEFYERLSSLFQMQEGGIVVSAPANTLSSAELVSAAKVPIEILALAHSCHTAPWACGNCRGCFKYRNVMRELGHG